MTSLPALSDIALIIVHHKRHSEIAEVVGGFLDQGIDPANAVVVDNSETPELDDALKAAVAPVRVLRTVNHGYGAAVNAGRRYLRSQGVLKDKLLVSTHEIRLGPHALQRLSEGLDVNPRAGAVGPVLRTTSSNGTEVVWSRGGGFTTVTRQAFHHTEDTASGSSVTRDWLDGALVLYRASAVPAGMFDESFEMYMEEVDLHLRMKEAGWQLLNVAEAEAWQSSGGTPPYFFARNLRLLSRKHAGRLRSLLIVGYGLTRRAAQLAKRRDLVGLKQLRRGWTAPLPAWRSQATLVNPLEAALAHYTSEISELAEATGVSLRVLSFPEPSASGERRVRWLLRYVGALLRAKRMTAAHNTVVAWPVLGYLDLALMSMLGVRGSIIIHDPTPLVHARGYSRRSKAIARRFGRRVRVVTHGRTASAEVEAALHTPPAFVPHPIRVSTSPEQDTNMSPRRRLTVLGQFKPDRDVPLLEWLAPRLPNDVELSIIGRHWPNVPGWNVDARFVSEAEFEDAVRTATAILIPYRRFYQSGVAIRALENDVAVIGPTDSVLADIFGSASPFLAGDSRESWLAAIEHALQSDRTQFNELKARYVSKAKSSWRNLLVSDKSGFAR